MSQSPILTATGVSKAFQSGDIQIEVLKRLDLTVKPGEFIAIEGRSGSGKSTLLHILGSLESVTEGETTFRDETYTLCEPEKGGRFGEWFGRGRILLWLIVLLCLSILAAILTRNHLNTLEEVSENIEIAIKWIFYGLYCFWGAMILGWLAYWLDRFWARRGYRQKQRSAAALRRKQFGFIFQFYHLLPELSVLENVVFPSMVDYGFFAYLKQRSRLRARASDILTELGMEHRLRHKPAQLSGGERQRVAIARALMNSPQVLFADEPTGNLDIETGKQIMRLLEDLHQKKGQTIVMVTHDRAVARQADRVVVMADGRLHAVSA